MDTGILVPKVEKDFYEILNRDDFLKYVLYSDTDSCYILVPTSGETDIYAIIRLVHNTAGSINKLIKSYIANYAMPRCGYDPSHNQTSFKEEIIMDSMIFIDVKKSYAYRQITAEAVVDDNNNLIKGAIFPEPEIKTKSNMGVKTNDAKITKNFLDTMIKVLLRDDLDKTGKRTEINKFIINQKEEFNERSNNLEFEYVGLPAKWKDRDQFILGMKLYNAICENEFQMSSAGYFYYVKFGNFSKIQSILDDKKINNLNGIVLPYKFDKDFVKSKLSEYQISLDTDTQWDKVFNTTCHRLYNLVKD